MALAKPVAGSPWSTTGSDIYFDAGNVGIGTADTDVRSLSVMKVESGTVSDNGSNHDAFRSIYSYNGTSSISPFAYIGSAVEGACFYGTDLSNPVGTQHAATFVSSIYSSGSSSNEWTPLLLWFRGLHTSNGGHIWGTDQKIYGPINIATEIIMGQSVQTINAHSTQPTDGAWGSVICSVPEQGDGTWVGVQTYPLNAMLALVGWSGYGNRSTETAAADAALQIGGNAGGWMTAALGNNLGSKFTKGITITDCDEACIDADGVIKIANNSPSTPEDGMMRFNEGSFQGYYNGEWTSLAGAGVDAFDGGSYGDINADTVDFDGGDYV